MEWERCYGSLHTCPSSLPLSGRVSRVLDQDFSPWMPLTQPWRSSPVGVQQDASAVELPTARISQFTMNLVFIYRTHSIIAVVCDPP